MVIPILAPVPVIKKPIIREPPKYFDIKTWGAEYRKTHAQDLAAKRKVKYEKDKHDILKNKQLWNLNHGAVTRPNQKSITEYKLYQTKEGVWRSRDDKEEEFIDFELIEINT